MSFHPWWAGSIGSGLILIALAIRAAIRSAPRNPEKREQRRRMLIHDRGRLGDALITGFAGTVLYYSYSVYGVQYSASQDIWALQDRLPEDLQRLIGRAHLKYLIQNPANSIVICEEWSGLVHRPAKTAGAAPAAC